MTEYKSQRISDETWIGIFKTNNFYKVRVFSPSSIEMMGSENSSMKLVYFRRFTETLLALGYKEVLQKLSISSLKALIRKENPTFENLKHKIPN